MASTIGFESGLDESRKKAPTKLMPSRDAYDRGVRLPTSLETFVSKSLFQGLHCPVPTPLR